MALASIPIKNFRPGGWTRWARVWLVGCLLAVVLPVDQALAQENSAAVIDIATVLAELGDDDYAVRQAVMHRLLSDDLLTQEDLNRLYAKSATIEQRHRLLLVTRHHMIRRMIDERFGDQVGPGSMGLSHHVVRVTGPDQVTERVGVMVVMTLPGFPAYALLDPGDVIVDFAGQPIPDRITPLQFQKLIQTHQAGETIELTLMRDGEPVKIPFMLCQGQALGEVYDTTGITLKQPYLQAWRIERARMVGLVKDDDGDDGGGVDRAVPPAE